MGATFTILPKRWAVVSSGCQWELGGENFSGGRCVSCGEILDEMILENRQAGTGRKGGDEGENRKRLSRYSFSFLTLISLKCLR